MNIKLTNDHLRLSSKENSSYEDLHRRMCSAEREKEQALSRLDAKEAELKKLQSIYETEKSKNYQIVQELSEKAYKSTRDLEKLAEEHAKLIDEIDELKKQLNSAEVERDSIQKKLTKQVRLEQVLMFIIKRLSSMLLSRYKCTKMRFK